MQFPDKKYDIILADPPWSHYGDPNKNAAAGKWYDLMSQDELAALPIRELANDKAALFLWATCPRLDLAIDMIKQWGFHYRGVAYIWIKTRKDGGIISGQGIPPTFVKPTTELVLAATTKKRGRAWPLLVHNQSQLVFAPRSEHSAKPLEIHKRIVELAGDRSRIELFSRREIEGWDGWGLEYPAQTAQESQKAQ